MSLAKIYQKSLETKIVCIYKRTIKCVGCKVNLVSFNELITLVAYFNKNVYLYINNKNTFHSTFR